MWQAGLSRVNWSLKATCEKLAKQCKVDHRPPVAKTNHKRVRVLANTHTNVDVLSLLLIGMGVTMCTCG